MSVNQLWWCKYVAWATNHFNTSW